MVTIQHRLIQVKKSYYSCSVYLSLKHNILIFQDTNEDLVSSYFKGKNRKIGLLSFMRYFQVIFILIIDFIE